MRLTDLILILIANLAWGLNFIAGKFGTECFGPLLFTSLRFLFLLVLLLPWLRPVRGSMMPLLKIAFLLGVLHFSMMFIGIHAGGNISSVAIASQLYVPFSALLASFFLKERISAIKWSAIIIAFLGVGIIGFDPVVFSHVDALLWVAGAAFAMAVATILMRQCPDLGVLRLQAWIAIVATPSLLFLSFLFESGQIGILQTAKLTDFILPLYSSVGASILGHGIVYYLLGKYSVSTVSPLLLLAPIFATIFGVIFLSDEMSGKIVTGGFLTLLGIAVLSVKQRKKAGG